jgi:NAD(P)-dependent dehydrogenase (short-subunit alcohol dehydrogenase family)
MIDVHYMGTVHVTFAAWPHLIKAGCGRIVNTSSEAALGMVQKNTAYGGAKGGVLGFTRTLALDAARYGIRVNAVMPRANTRLSDVSVLSHTYDLPADAFKDGIMDQLRPELVSPVAAYLAHESCQLNGELLPTGGGQVMRVALVQNEGFTKEDLTPEDVATNLQKVMDLSDAHEVKVGTLLAEVDH